MLNTLVALAAMNPAAPAPVTLSRKFVAGQKLAYTIDGELRAEDRGAGLDTWIPDNVNLSYGFTMTVQKLKSDGIVDVLYRRPTFTETQDEDFDSGPKKHVDHLDEKLLLTLSPINQILDVKDLNPDSKKKKKDDGDGDGDGGDGGDSGNFVATSVLRRQEVLDPTQFLDELHRLSIFVGSFDSALDFNPKLPLDKVAIGDTWKQTVSYQPQKLKGDKKGNQEVQRLDYVFTYQGPKVSNGKQVERVEATLDLNTDLGAFFNQLLHATPEQSQLEKIPMHLKASIDFDLDPKSFTTLRAVAKSEGDFAIWIHGQQDRAAFEEKFRGTTTETLTGQTIVK
jgi:hypothetical protein